MGACGVIYSGVSHGHVAELGAARAEVPIGVSGVGHGAGQGWESEEGRRCLEWGMVLD